ncbi:hypothetical protein MNEG_9772 [Monoraphidium neglectum]|uniref:Uncharacterized protein n=1 Tax=Monoraphidium neglectum TaxID=145388 RepID=A0A0D2JFE5_9CHLO|nr:hypothetical protein MNEG_9772 [Monoraphidium neglectum]KIY98187.1 hypothetical protein MNEG_9772 [Monoraphidium neglectum]|eukprot:XP_013897207.1 hypothetical protein MNEG_9772 [Monoraphidium neglectum]
MASTANAAPPEVAENGEKPTRNPKGLGPALPGRPGKGAAGGGSGSGAAPAAGELAPSEPQQQRPAAKANGVAAAGKGAAEKVGAGGSQIRPFLPARGKAAAKGNSSSSSGGGVDANPSEQQQEHHQKQPQEQQQQQHHPSNSGAAGARGAFSPAAKPAAVAAAAASPGALSAAPRGGMPSLPQRLAASSSCGVIDPEEPEATQKLRVQLHGIRVNLIRIAKRLGYDHDNGIVKQVLYRFYLAEKLKEPFRKGVRRPDPAVLAAREALRLEEAEGPSSPLGLRIKILVIGLAGSGKTQLIRSLLGGPLADNRPQGGGRIDAVDAFSGTTTRVQTPLDPLPSR